MTEQLALPEDFKGKDLLPALSNQTQLIPSGDIVGYDNVEPEDLVLPVIKCLQGMSPEVMQEAHPDARPGRFFLTSTREAFAGPLRVLVVHHHRSRALFPDSKNPKTASLKVCLSSDALKGTVYGYCSDCGGEISEQRLRALPFAVRCKDCEESREVAAEREKAMAQKRNGPAFFFDMSS